jgi:hypothetical protein
MMSAQRTLPKRRCHACIWAWRSRVSSASRSMSTNWLKSRSAASRSAVVRPTRSCGAGSAVLCRLPWTTGACTGAGRVSRRQASATTSSKAELTATGTSAKPNPRSCTAAWPSTAVMATAPPGGWTQRKGNIRASARPAAKAAAAGVGPSHRKTATPTRADITLPTITGQGWARGLLGTANSSTADAPIVAASHGEVAPHPHHVSAPATHRPSMAPSTSRARSRASTVWRCSPSHSSQRFPSRAFFIVCRFLEPVRRMTLSRLVNGLGQSSWTPDEHHGARGGASTLGQTGAVRPRWTVRPIACR